MHKDCFSAELMVNTVGFGFQDSCSRRGKAPIAACAEANKLRIDPIGSFGSQSLDEKVFVLRRNDGARSPTGSRGGVF